MEFWAKWIVVIRQTGTGSPLVLVFSGCPEVVEVAEDKGIVGLTLNLAWSKPVFLSIPCSRITDSPHELLHAD